jgi:hypothetical protein
MRLWHYWPAAACQLDGHQRAQGQTGQRTCTPGSSPRFPCFNLLLLTDATASQARHQLIPTNWNICAGFLHKCSHSQCFRLEEQDTVSDDGLCQTEGSSQRLKLALQGMQQHAERVPLLQPSPQCIQCRVESNAMARTRRVTRAGANHAYMEAVKALNTGERQRVDALAYSAPMHAERWLLQRCSPTDLDEKASLLYSDTEALEGIATSVPRSLQIVDSLMDPPTSAHTACLAVYLLA